jgi:hypothetical protein
MRNLSKILVQASAMALVILGVSAPAIAQASLDEAMDGLVTRLYATRTLDQLYALTHDEVLAELTAQERNAFATQYWSFDVNVPVVVSIMRNTGQENLPFWIEATGFQKTDMIVKNAEDWEYEVWQKEFSAGRVELGVNGLESFTRPYFVAVGATNAGDVLELSNFFPESQRVLDMTPGSMIYHDWTELVLTEVPESMAGHKLLPTYRGRGKEAGLVGSFRETPFPSSIAPDPVYLTWSADPRTTQNIQWRTNDTLADGVVRYREKGASAFQETTAIAERMEDRMLANDRYCQFYTAVLEDLKPATTYEYQAGSSSAGAWSALAEFVTAPDEAAPFSFFHCSDTHSNEQWGALLAETFARHPDTNFCVISGDLVGTGMEREDWDMTLEYGEPMFHTRPIMPTVGNHDAQLGLGAGMYLDIFGLPENGPKENLPETAYTFRYSNAEFFVLDVMSDTNPQGIWLEEQLKKSDAHWKIAIFHFPFYAREKSYSDLHEAWGTLFDRYHVDLVLTGHIHTYMRTHPMRAGEPVESTKDGTVYVTSVSIPGRPTRGDKPAFAAAAAGGGLLCNVISVDGDRLTFRAETVGGEVKDEFVIEK